MERKRVYHPETNQPFDPPVARANRLILDFGWLQQPIDPDAIALVQDTPREVVEDTRPEDTGRGSRSRRRDVQEVVEVPEDPADEAEVADTWQSSPQEVEA